MKPWADCLNNSDRLNPYNGLLLAAHWDAAFDSGLVTFEDGGEPRLSERLSDGARRLLPNPSSPPRIDRLRADHLPFLPTTASTSGDHKRVKTAAVEICGPVARSAASA